MYAYIHKADLNKTDEIFHNMHNKLKQGKTKSYI